MCAGIDFRSAGWEYGGDCGKIPTAIEIFLDGSGDEETIYAVNDAVRADDGVGEDDGSEIDLVGARFRGGEMDFVSGEGAVSGEGEGGGNSSGDEVEEEERLEGFQVAWFEKESLEIGI